MNITLDNYTKFSFKNRKLLTDEYSCYFCFHIGKVEEINEWADGNLTACCYRCTIDSVLPGKIDTELLKQFYEKSFSPSTF